MDNSKFPCEMIEKMQKIADKTDFSYDKKSATTLTGSCFGGSRIGSGPYHEECALYVVKESNRYLFIEEDIAPMVGSFRWIFLNIPTDKVKTEEELQCLKQLLREKRFK